MFQKYSGLFFPDRGRETYRQLPQLLPSFAYGNNSRLTSLCVKVKVKVNVDYSFTDPGGMEG